MAEQQEDPGYSSDGQASAAIRRHHTRFLTPSWTTALLLGEDEAPAQQTGSARPGRELLVRELRQARRRRTDTIRLDKHVVFDAEDDGATKSAPAALGGWWCGGPPACCPGAGGEEIAFTSKVSKEKEAEAIEGAKALTEADLGLPSLEEAGWAEVDEPGCMELLRDEEQRQHIRLCKKALNISWVSRMSVCGDDVERIMVTFPKCDVPGKVRDVKALLSKLEKIDHSNIVKLIQACEDSQTLYLIYEAPRGMGQLRLQVTARGQRPPPTECARLCRQLAAGLLHARRLGVELLDWSLWNIMSVSSRSLLPVRLFGVGLAGVLHTARAAKARRGGSAVDWALRGTCYFASPELCRCKCDPEISNPFARLDHADKAATDVWGIGAVTYMLLAGHTVFGGESEKEVLERTVPGKVVFGPSFEDVEAVGMSLVERMLLPNPKDRPQLKAVIGDIWVVAHVRASGDRDEVNRVFGRLQMYAGLRPVMRSVGSVLVESLRPEKRREIEDVFHMLDSRGDGALEASEFCEFLPDLSAEVREVFSLMKAHGTQGLDLHDFMLANAFGEDVLTERTLIRAFDRLDADRTGKVSATDLYSSLRLIQEDITPDMVADFMGDVDRDWDEDMDFREFCACFPKVRSRAQDQLVRRFRSEDLLGLCREVFGNLSEDTRRWRAQAEDQRRRAGRAKRSADEQMKWAVRAGKKFDSKNKDWCRDMREALRKILKLVKHPPIARLPAEDELKTARLASKGLPGEDDSRKGSKERATEKLVAQEPDRRGGAVALRLGGFLTASKRGWMERLKPMIEQAAVLESEHNQIRKRMDAIVLLDEVDVFCEEMLCSHDRHMAEQGLLMEASETEPALPPQPFVRRGVISTLGADKDGTVAQDVHAFKQERRRRLEAAEAMTQRRREREATISSSARTGVEGERRGIEWQARRAARAERKATLKAWAWLPLP